MSNKKESLTEDKGNVTSPQTDETGNVASEECKHFIYIGPSLPQMGLKSNTVLCGSIETIKVYYKEVLVQYPQVVRLIVPVQKLGELKGKTQTPGNIINKYYSDIVSAMNNNKEE